MSTLAYAALTSKREEATPGTSTQGSAPGVRTYVDALAGLVPAEVLAAHGAILTFTTETKDGAVTITQPATLVGVFYALILLSAMLYVAGRLSAGNWERWDCIRVLIPPLAFVGWTMLQKATAFDAVAPSLSQAPRSAIAIIGGIFLGLVATSLAYKADQSQ
jgi:hypothetical protein